MKKSKSFSMSRFKNFASVAGFILIAFAAIAVVGLGDGIEEGDRVKVHYIGYLDDGTEFDSTSGKDPFEFTVGSGVIKGFSDAMVGKRVGDEFTIDIPPEEGYGDRRPDFIVVLDKAAFGGTLPSLGEQVTLGLSQGGQLIGTVIDVSGQTATVDANHPLAGKTLHFNVIVEAKE